MFVPDKPFQPSVMFAGKAGAYPSEVPYRCPHTKVGPGLALKH